MPEAAIDESNNTAPPNDNVRCSRKPSDMSLEMNLTLP